MNTYEAATRKMKNALSDLSNADRLRLTGALVLVLAEMEESEYFCLDTNGDVQVVLLTGDSAKRVAESIKNGEFKEGK